MSSREDVIEVPIEIQTSDLEELQRLIQQLQEAKSTADQIKSTRRKMPSGGSGAPIQRGEEEPMGIFRPSDELEVLPTKPRDTKSKQALQRGDSFKDLQDKVKDLETVNSDLSSVLMQLGGVLGFNIPYLGAGLKGVRVGKKFTTVLGNKTPSVGKALPAGGTGKFSKLFAAIPYVGSAIMLADFLINDLPDIIMENLYGVGKPFDRRFRRVLEKEFASMLSMELKAQIAQGYRSVITTSYTGARGATNVSNSKIRALNKENLYNISDEYKLR